MKKIINKLACKAQATAATVQSTLATRRGEMYIDTGVKVLIVVVLGALLLTTLYALFNTNILTNITNAINSLFAYDGAVGDLTGGMGG